MSGHFDLAPAEWETLRRLLQTALELDPAARDAWVDGLAGEHAAFKRRLRALLAHAHPSTGLAALDTLPKIETAQFLAERAAERPRDVGAARGRSSGDAGAGTGVSIGERSGEQAEDRIGPYRLLRPLGAGGMGAVWLAERTDMLQRRQVALKLPHGAWRRAGLAERLAREREILAALNHPNIARLYDAGVAADGQPYLALEYVEGERIDAYCARKALDVPARLRLFLQVTRAVAHAHANLVVHRDLKPTNILVTDAGEVRLLDFGIAKLLEQGQAHETELTQVSGRALTPDYAAPEQILGQPISTAADIYALGVVLFELLAGSRPYRLKRDSRAALEEAIVQADVPRPSEAVGEARLRKLLRGDLDTIVLKALKNLPVERYATVDALAEDIERHLAQRPVQAQPDSRMYRLHKFIARNRPAVGAAGAVLVAIVAGAGVALWQAQVARAEQRRAESVKEFIASIFRDADPWVGAQSKPSVPELLKRAKGQLGDRFTDSPLIRIELLNTIGASLFGLQDVAAAREVLQEALAAGERELPPGHPHLLRSRYFLAKTHQLAGETAQLKAELEVLVPQLERQPRRFAEELAEAVLLQSQVAMDSGRFQEMQALGSRALEIAQASLPPDHRVRLLALREISAAYENLRHAGEALRYAQEAYELSERIFRDQPKHPMRVETRFIYARTLHLAGQTKAALPLMRQSIADGDEVFGPSSARVGVMLRITVNALIAANLLEEALVASDRAYAIATGNHAPDSIHLAYAVINRAAIRRTLRRTNEAIEDYDHAYRIIRSAMGEDKHYALHVRGNRAHALAEAGRTSEAVAELDHVVERHRVNHYGQLMPMVLSQALAHRLDGKAQSALAILRDNAQVVSSKAERTRFHFELGLALLAVGSPAEALPELRAAQALITEAESPPAPHLMDLEHGLGRAHLALGQAEQGLPHLQRADAFWRGFDAESRWAGEAAYWLARCYAALGRTADAKQVHARAAKILARSPFPSDTRLVQLARAK